MSARLVSVDDLVTIDEIARRLHWSVNCALNVATGRDGRYKIKFPHPLVGPAKRGVWLWDDVEQWYNDVVPKGKDTRSRSSKYDDAAQRKPSWSTGAKAS